MPKLKAEPIDNSAIQQYLAENDDFAFEVHCLREIRKRRVTVSHAGTYSDPVTNKSRQFDFRIEIEHDHLRIALAVECKNLKPNFPLLISCLPRLPQEAFHQLLTRSTPEEQERGSFVSSASLFPSDLVSVRTPWSLYAEHDMVGKSTVQIGREANGKLYGDDSEVYEKWAQAVSSAYGLIADAASSFGDTRTRVMAYFILPVVVVPNQMLWEIDYSAAGEILGEPKTADEIALFLDYSPWKIGQMFSYTVSHLHFVTLRGLCSLIDRMLVNSHFIQRIFPAGLQSQKEAGDAVPPNGGPAMP